MVNFISSQHYQRYDWTRGSFYTLSGKTKNIIAGLDNDINLTVFYQPSNPIYQKLQDLLAEYRNITRLINVEYIDPDRDVARARALADKFKADAYNIVVLEYQGKYKYISDQDLAVFDYSGVLFGRAPQMVAFKGEEGVTSAILSLTEEAQIKVSFVTGHGEQNLGLLKQKIERDNAKVEDIRLFGLDEISPDEIALLIIAGPTKTYTKEEVELLGIYLDSGGKLLCLLDPMTISGVEGLLQEWGIELGVDVVVDPARKLPYVSAANLFVADYPSDSPITRELGETAIMLPLARSVDIIEGIEGLEVKKLATTSEYGWGETKLNEERFEFNQAEDKQGPVSVAVQVEKKDSARIVVFGDSDFATNEQINTLGNGDLLNASINWLTQREKLIAINPKVPEDTKLALSSRQMSRIFWQVVAGMPGIAIILGILVWWRRRK